MADTQQEVKVRCRHVYTLFTGDDDFAVCKYTNVDTGEEFVANGKRLPMLKNVDYALYGTWQRNNYGPYFKVSTSEVSTLDTLEGLTAYVTSLKCKIGPRAVQRIWKRFGQNSWEIICTRPEALIEVFGISQKKVELLKERMKETVLRRELSTFLHTPLTPANTDAITKRFGSNALRITQEDPYRLNEVKGFSFPAVDAICAALPNRNVRSGARLRGALRYFFGNKEAAGNTCVRASDAAAALTKLTAQIDKTGELPQKEIEAYLNACVKDGTARFTSGFLYSAWSSADENFLAKDLYARGTRKLAFPIQAGQWLADYEESNAIRLADCQRAAVLMTLEHSFTVITGGPGTGKSTITKAIVAMHTLAYPSTPIHLLAPTGRAARRMAECTGYPASTIHSAIGYVCTESDGDVMDGDITLDGLIIVDEVSMMDQHIAALLLQHIMAGSRIVFIGDADQLPSVGAGNVLYDIIRSKVLPVQKLDTTFRQKGLSPIVVNAAKIREGKTDLVYEKSFQFVEAEDSQTIFDKAVSWYVRCAKGYGVDNVLLLCPFRDKTEVCVKRLNDKIHDLINPPVNGQKVFKSAGTEYRIGDKVMQLRNTEFAKNGDTGYIRDIIEVSEDEDSDTERFCVIEFNGDGVRLKYSAEHMRDITLAYCCSVHKSQGLECDTVLVVATMEHRALLQRNLYYTAITRAKKNVAIIGQRKALNYAIGNNKTETRMTLLADRLVALAKQKSS